MFVVLAEVMFVNEKKKNMTEMFVRFQHILNNTDLRSQAGWVSFSSRCVSMQSMICRPRPGD